MLFAERAESISEPEHERLIRREGDGGARGPQTASLRLARSALRESRYATRSPASGMAGIAGPADEGKNAPASALPMQGSEPLSGWTITAPELPWTGR